jgi:hypothetical protein
MRQSMTIRLDQDLLNQAKAFAGAENRTLTNYIETLIKRDVSSSKKKIEGIARDMPLTVFIPEPVTKRMVTRQRDDDALEDLAKRQTYLDLISGWTE